MSTFADSSALVKLYWPEPGHERVRALDTVLVSQLARVEVPAALWRKCRMGEVSRDHTRVLVTTFEVDYEGSVEVPPRFDIVAMTDVITASAAEFTEVHGLRAYDAVQLATAVAARRVVPACDTMAVFDRQLREAAAAEGFSLLPGTV